MSMNTVSEFHAEAPQATASEALAHGPYVAVKARFKPATLQMKGVESTNGSPCPTTHQQWLCLVTVLLLIRLMHILFTYYCSVSVVLFFNYCTFQPNS